MPKSPSTPGAIPPRWFRLDNAAKLYPAINTGNSASTFRLAVLLQSGPVDPDRLQYALQRVLPRFPALAVRMHRGIFWYYLGHNPGCPRVQPVFHYDRRIAVEFFHALTDGHGALVFLKTLVAEYLLRCGTVPVPPSGDLYGTGLLDPDATPHPEEYEDAYRRYAPARSARGRKEPKAFHVASTGEPIHTLDIITGITPLTRVREVSRGFGVSLTEYLAAVYMDVLCAIQRDESACSRPHSRRPRPVRLQVPVDLRRFFPTRSARNFSFFVDIGIDTSLGQYSFDEILRTIHHTLRLGLDPRSLGARISQNVRSERNPFLRVAPLFIKNFAIAQTYRRVGEPASSGTLTNLGPVGMPESLTPSIERFEIILGPSFVNRTNCAVASFGDRLVITFSRTCRETEIERGFFTRLVRDGIPVRIESNR